MFYRILVLITLATSLPGIAATSSPWGSAQELEIQYAKQKVVYDTAVSTVAALTSVLDRASYLSTLNGADPFEIKL